MNLNFVLYHYWRSSASWRVRAAFAHKAIPYKAIPISLLNDETDHPSHVDRNPARAVPVLEIDDGRQKKNLTESLAMIQYLEQLYPEPALLPKDPYFHARTWALAEVINSGTHPLQNPPVLEMHAPGNDDEAQNEKRKWARTVIQNGLQVYEDLSRDVRGSHSIGNTLTLADLCLIPQVYNAYRFEVAVENFPWIHEFYQRALTFPAIQESHPDRFKS